MSASSGDCVLAAASMVVVVDSSWITGDESGEKERNVAFTILKGLNEPPGSRNVG